MTKAIIGNLQMFPIDSHKRDIKDREKQIMSNAPFKETSFKLNQPIYQIRNLRSEHMLLGNQVFIYKNIACKFVSTKTHVNSHECEHKRV